MISPLFENIVDRIFEQDLILHRLVQRIKNERDEETKNDASSEDKKIL